MYAVQWPGGDGGGAGRRPAGRRRPIATPLVLLGLMLALTACNTVSGVGRDIEAAGGAITRSAEDVKEGR